MQVQLQEFIEEHELFNRNDELILAVSGGADSIAMLHLIYGLKYRCSVAHCNFNLRGTESRADQDFVQKLATQLEIPFFTIDFNTKLYAEKQGLSIQEAARELRYQWFSELHRARNAFILTAHQLDDHLETILINWGRGTGTKGLCGIPLRREYIRRPMLCFTSNQLREWCAENGIRYREDSSNEKTDYLRNYLRKKVIPPWKEQNPGLLLKSFTNSRLIESQIQNNSHLVDLFRTRECRTETDEFRIPISGLLRFPHPDLLLYDLLNTYRFHPDVCRQLGSQLESEPGAVYHSSTHEALRDREWIYVYRRPQEIELSIPGPGMYTFGPYSINIETVRMDELTLGTNPGTAFFNSSSLRFPLTVRNWREGDRIQPFGMKGHKLLSDVFVDQKIPLHRKRQIPIFCSGPEILWIHGLMQSEQTRVNRADDFAWKLTCKAS